jgi:hypothetical protein
VAPTETEGSVGLWDRLHKDDAVAEAAVTGLTIGDGIAVARERKEVWGRPSRCPKCSEPGYLDKVDVVDRIQYEHCTSCFHKWSVREEDTVHVDA